MHDITEQFSLKIFKDHLNRHGISMAFHGMLSNDILTLVANSFKDIPENRMLSRRLVFLIIEMAQNIHRYSAMKLYSQKDGRQIGVGMLAVGESENHHIISSGNYVLNSEIDVIAKRSEKINLMSQVELDEFYRKVRREPQRPDKPGANLGFIEMRRKSGNPIEVIFHDFDDEHSFFILSVRINKHSLFQEES